MSIDERVRAENEALRSLIRDAGDRAPLIGGLSTEDDGAGRMIRLPAPSGLLLDGRRVRTRHRVRAASLAAAAALVVAVGAVGAGSGAFTLPWLRADGSTGPSTLYASSGTRVGDLVNAMDHMTLVGWPNARWVYRSGPDVAPNTVQSEEELKQGEDLPRVRWGDEDGVSVPATVDRVVSLSPDGETSETATQRDVVLTQVDPGDRFAEVGTRRLGALEFAPGDRGTWLQARPSAQDGWVVVGLLPADADAIQVRLAGSEVLLPLSDDFAERGSCGHQVERADGETACQKPSIEDTPSTVHVRFATTDADPPIDAITYIDRNGSQVVVGTEAGRTVK